MKRLRTYTIIRYCTFWLYAGTKCIIYLPIPTFNLKKVFMHICTFAHLYISTAPHSRLGPHSTRYWQWCPLPYPTLLSILYPSPRFPTTRRQADYLLARYQSQMDNDTSFRVISQASVSQNRKQSFLPDVGQFQCIPTDCVVKPYMVWWLAAVENKRVGLGICCTDLSGMANLTRWGRYLGRNLYKIYWSTFTLFTYSPHPKKA